jgi:DNA-binding transcriptional ArsR family regulator
VSQRLGDGRLARLADCFKGLAEPARLRILYTLGRGELTVSQLIEETGLGQANVSKHLQVLRAAGFVERRKEGLFVYYSLADGDVLELCDLVSRRVERQAEADLRAFPKGA